MSKNQVIDLSVDLTKALLWQYDNAPKLQAIVDQKNAWYQTAQVTFWENWITNVFDIRTADSFGLDLWGIIVGIGRGLNVPEGGYNFSPFNTAPCNFGGFNPNYQLDDAMFRKLILAKTLTNVSRNTIPNLNAIIVGLFGDRGTVYYSDNGNMSISFHFNFQLRPYELAILTQSTALNKPAAVSLNYVHD